jgi:adenylate kinase
MASLRAPLARGFATTKWGNNLLFLGAPGVGKGTFAERIAPKLGIPAISTGDIIRGEIQAKSEMGLKLKSYTDSGKLVPDEIVSAMVRERLKKSDAKNGWILVRAKGVKERARADARG